MNERLFARLAAVSLLLLAACATGTPVAAPQWDAVPPAVSSALCTRLQMDAIGTGGGLTLASRTRPFVTAAAVASLAASARGRIDPERAAAAIAAGSRELAVQAGEGPCGWVLADPAQRTEGSDEVLVELSAPLVNPVKGGEPGLFARAGLPGQEEWYWIVLGSHGGAWSVRGIHAISR